MKIEFCNEVPQKKRKPIEGENIKLIERLIKKTRKMYEDYISIMHRRNNKGKFVSFPC